jgi:hypothetical protein
LMPGGARGIGGHRDGGDNRCEPYDEDQSHRVSA